jgi:hypothetical protein
MSVISLSAGLVLLISTSTLVLAMAAMSLCLLLVSKGVAVLRGISMWFSRDNAPEYKSQHRCLAADTQAVDRS